jgi:lipopolysaccharide export system protein LptA
VIYKSLPNLLIAVMASSAVFAQDATPKPLTQADLLKQIETLNPAIKPPSTPEPAPTVTASPFASPAIATAAGVADSLLNGTGLPGAPGTPAPSGTESGDKKEKGPTIITALEATFDQRKNVAVFIGNVVVKDPEFNVTCDKLTAYLKHDEPPAKGPKGAVKATPAPATPSPTGGTPVKKKSGGLDKAHAERTTEKRVIITQDKVEEDGTITHSIGISDVADYDTVTGDVILHGWPDVTQKGNRCIATDPSTWMRLNRDGHMDAHGPHRTIIIDTGDSRDKPSTPAPSSSSSSQTQ